MTADEICDAVDAAQDVSPVDLSGLLAKVRSFVRRYVVLTDLQIVAVALWVAHTWVIEAAEATPYLEIVSAEKRCGKSRLLEVLAMLVARPWLTGHVSAAVLVRKVAQQGPTLLLDESDAAFKGDREYAETLRGVLNGGHRRGGVHSLCVKTGQDFDFRDFSVFCPKAIAGIGKLPDTVSDRSIRIEMRRRTPAERVERFRRREAEGESRQTRDGLERWATAAVDTLQNARPDIPEALDDRAADGWEPLLAIADTAGGAWPERARHAALALSTGAGREDDSFVVRLLSDIWTVFDEKAATRLATGALLDALHAMDHAPWGKLKGAPMDAPTLARLLRPYGVKPKKLREGSTTWRGYERAAFADPWSRYVTPERVEHAEQAEHGADLDSNDVPGVPGVPGVKVSGSELRYCPHPKCIRILTFGEKCTAHIWAASLEAAS